MPGLEGRFATARAKNLGENFEGLMTAESY
jgi:hypothetical protein